MQKIKKFLFQNTSTKQTIAKNTFWLFFGEIIGRLLKLFIIVFATRKLGVEGWGLFAYSLSFISFFYFLGDFGVNTFLTREMSKDNASRHKYLSTAIILKVTLLATFFIVSLIIGPHIGRIRLPFTTILVFSTFFVSESLREFAMSINRSLQKMENEGLSKVLINLTITVVGIILVAKNHTSISLAIAYMIGSAISTFFIFWSIRSEFKNIEWKFSKTDFKTIYDFSWPLIILGFFTLVFSIDSIMLGQIRSESEVGLYAASQRLVQFASIIPTFISISIFPILAKRDSNQENPIRVFEKIMTIVMAIALPITIGGIFFSAEIVRIILGPQYIQAVPVLRVLMGTILALFPDMMLNNLIYSKNLQKIFLKTTSFGLGLNLILNVLLIPKFGAVGAAISTTSTQLLIMTLNWNRLKKNVSFSVLPKLKKIYLANIAMTLIILSCFYFNIKIIYTALIAILSYAGCLKLLKEPIIEELISFIKKNKNIHQPIVDFPNQGLE